MRKILAAAFLLGALACTSEPTQPAPAFEGSHALPHALPCHEELGEHQDAGGYQGGLGCVAN